jgi:hypothetical protein
MLGVVKEIEVMGVPAFAWRYKEPMQGADLAEVK